MKRVGQFVKAGVMQWVALAILGFAMFSAGRRTAIPAVLAIFKVLWPFLVIWIIWRFLKAKITGVVGKFQDQVMQAAQQNGASANFARPAVSRPETATGSGGEILDLCPKCGILLTTSHRC